jgi:polysaccharide pyruvyl transferase WcaK-like protein
MTIGITTIHRICNYGSALQTYALQRSISKLGYDCEVIDYIYPNSFHLNARSPVGMTKPKLSDRAKNAVAEFITQKRKREQRFAEFLSGQIKLSTNHYNSMETIQDDPPFYDTYVTGSDQVWNPRYMLQDPTFLLEFALPNARRIAYAASFGDSRIDPQYKELYQRNLRKFHAISVRESQGMQIVSDLIGKKPSHVLDPTMLLDETEWKHLTVVPKLQKKYILCYFLGYAFNPFPYSDDLAEHIRRSTGYELVYLNPSIYQAFSPCIRAVYDAGPCEFLGWISNAEIVLTTSFHGTAFAANFNRPFLSLIDENSSLDCRQISLLNKIQLESQLLRKNAVLPECTNISPDFSAANKILENVRYESVDFLRGALQI